MMRHYLPLVLLAVAASLVSAAPPSIQLSGDQLSWSVAGARCGSSNHWLQVRDIAVGDDFAPVPVVGKNGSFTGSESGLRFSGQWATAKEAAVLHCVVEADPAKDRALIVRVSLPLSAVGGKWWDDANDSRAIEGGKNYTRVQDWYGMRKVSVYPLCAVTNSDQAGVALATPLDEPRIFRLSYDANRNALEAEFDLGLSPAATKMGPKADFHLYVYGLDPQWGFRDALRQYYALFPMYAQRRVDAAGIWLLGFRPETMACPWDWGFKFDEGAQSHALYDQKHDILSYVYTEPAGKYENFGQIPSRSGKPEYGEQAAPVPSAQLEQETIKDLNAPENVRDRHFGNTPRRVVAQADANSAIEDHDGNWIWRHWTNEWSSDGSWISNLTLNDDPDLPKPNRATLMWDSELSPAFELARKQGSDLSGVYLDSVCGFTGYFDENFRRDQWQYADVPLTISYQYKQPVQLHSFTVWQLVSQLSDQMWKQGKTVIGNTGRPEMANFVQRLDMIGSGETSRCGMAEDEHYRYTRAMSAGKAISFMDYGFVKPDVPWAEKERGLQRCLFYGVHPGTGSFDNPNNYEPSRPLYRYYEQLITWVDQAGWQPVTLATTTDANVMLERYGPGKGELAGVSFITVRNPGKEPVTATVRVAQDALPPSCRGANTKNCSAWLMVSDRPAKTQWVSSKVVGASTLPFEVRPVHAGQSIYARSESLFNIMEVAVPADGTEVIALGSRRQLAEAWLWQAQKWLDRLDREAQWLHVGGGTIVNNGDFEAGLAGWGVDTNAGKLGSIVAETAQPLSGKGSAKAVSEGEGAFQSLHQSLTLTSGDTYTLRFKYSWTRPEDAKGAFYARFGVKDAADKWVSDKYLLFRDVQPTDGKTVSYEKQFTVPEGYTAGFFQFMFEGNWGTAVLDDIVVDSNKFRASQQKLTDLQTEAHRAAAALATAAYPPTPSLNREGELTALINAQRPLYEKLLALAQSPSDPHLRRCLGLPVYDFAEALGRAGEVVTGVTLHLQDDALFADAGVGAAAQVALQPSDPKGVVQTVPEETGMMMPAQMGWGWSDLHLDSTVTIGKQKVWMPRRVTVRLHPSLQVEPTGPVSAVSGGVPLSVTAWLSGQTELPLGGKLLLGQTPVTVPPTRVPLVGRTGSVLVPLPSDARAALDDAARQMQPAKLQWTAGEGRQGETPLAVVRGTACPVMASPVLDGRVDAAEWAGAAKVTGFVTPDQAKPAARATEVLLGHDAQKLYLAFICHGQSNPTAPQRGRDGAIWEDDAAEVFLEAPGSEEYYHFGINAVGSILDGRCAPNENTGWNGNWEAKTSKIADGYVIEIAIPFATVGGKPEGLWRVNFGREEADTHTPTCWNPTGGGFHMPKRFGEMGI